MQLTRSSSLALTFLGAGTGRPQSTIGGPALLIRHSRGGAFLVDAAPGTAAALQRFGPATPIEAVFVTRLRAGHVGGLPDVLSLLRDGRAADAAPLLLAGPGGLSRGLASDLLRGVELHEYASSQPLCNIPSSTAAPQWRVHQQTAGNASAAHSLIFQEPDYHALDVERVASLGLSHERLVELEHGYEVVVAAGQVVVRPDDVAVRVRGRKIVVLSGLCNDDDDDDDDDDFVARAADADVLICDAVLDGPAAESTVAQSARLAERVGAKHLVFSHWLPELANRLVDQIDDVKRNTPALKHITVATDSLTLLVPDSTQRVVD